MNFFACQPITFSPHKAAFNKPEREDIWEKNEGKDENAGNYLIIFKAGYVAYIKRGR